MKRSAIRRMSLNKSQRVGRVFSTITAARTPVKKRNAKRATREWKRAYGSVARVNWIAGLTCVACGYGRNCENHHIVSGGTSRKADARFIVPLCWVCHRELHQQGRAAFEAYYEVSLEHEAEKTDAAWLAFVRGETTPSLTREREA